MRYEVTLAFNGDDKKALDIYHQMVNDFYSFTNGEGAVRLELVQKHVLSHDIIHTRQLIRAGSNGSY